MKIKHNYKRNYNQPLCYEAWVFTLYLIDLEKKR